MAKDKKTGRRKAEPDQEERIERMREELEELGGEVIRSDDEELPSEVEEKFLEYVLAWERAEPTTYLDALERAGKSIPDPAQLTDQELTGKLWDLINALALLQVFLHNTDHLSDRQLYETLYHDCLREETVLFPENPDYGCHIDMVGSGSEEEIYLQLKYYADEEMRQQWLEDFPDYELPEPAAPPHDRDRHLPEHQVGQPASSEQ